MPKITYILDVDLTESTASSCNQAVDQSRLQTSKFAFLQIYNGLEKASSFVQVMQAAQTANGLTPTASSRQLHYLALKYLDMQGVAEIVWGSGSIVVADALQLSVDAWTPWGPSLFEECVVCCAPVAYESLAGGRLLDVPPGDDSSCVWMNVNGLASASVEGVYKLQNVTSFGHSVWKQEPGETFIYFLNHACTDDNLCGNTLDSATAARGPAWVSGPVVGSSRFNFYTTSPWLLPPFKLLDSYSMERNVPFTDRTEIYGTFSPVWRQMKNGILQMFMPRLFCSQQPVYRYSKTSLQFSDPTAHRKLSIPDRSGKLLTSGSLDDIIGVGVLVSPIIGLNSALQATRIKFGTGWQTVRIRSGLNDKMDLSWSSGGFKYCTASKLACQLPPYVGQFVNLNNIDGCPLPLTIDSLRGCMFPSEKNVTGTSGVDAIIVPHQYDTSCVSMYLTDEFLQGPASYAELSESKCSTVEKDGDPMPVAVAVLAVGELPPYWGIDTAECQANNWNNAQCSAYMLSGCKNACLRQRTCTNFRFNSMTFRCGLFVSGCKEVAGTDSGERYFRKLSGGYVPQRITSSDVNYYPEIGSRVILGHTPKKVWSVKGIFHLCDRDALGVDASNCLGRSLPLPISVNLTSRIRYQLCSADSSGPGIGENGIWTTLVTPIPLSNADVTVTVLNQSVSNFSLVRIADDIFQVLGSGGSASGRTLVLRRSSLTFKAESHQQGARVYGVEGGFWNTTWTKSFTVPQGVYTLENVTKTVNSNLDTLLWKREAFASLSVREPHDGLCGEVPHGSTYEAHKFHCAPASRFMQLTGGIQATEYSSASNNIRIWNSSTILNPLGIATPTIAYTFGLPANNSQLGNISFFPRTKARQHPVIEGAGFVSSGYGRESGFGMGGQARWTGFKPPGAQEDVGEMTVWCEDGAGYRCTSDPCNCSVNSSVATYFLVLGSTKAQDGTDPKDNILLIPQGSDGVLVSTGNLEDIGLDSAALTGLSIHALSEHATATAVRVHGMAEFGKCNSIFGDSPECTADSALNGGISLSNSTGQLSVNTFWKNTIWAAVYTRPEDPVLVAANNRDYNSFWRLFPSDPLSVNRTWSTLQDTLSLQLAGRLCKDYCIALVALQKQEAAAATQAAAEIEVTGATSVATALADTTKYCFAARCPATGIQYETTGAKSGNSSVTNCNNKCPSACTCSRFSSCADIWGKNATTFGGNEVLWLLCVKLLQNQADFSGNAVLKNKYAQQLANYSYVTENIGLLGTRDQQQAEAELVCSCVEIQGESTDVRDKVQAHDCPEYTKDAVDIAGITLSPPQNVTARVCVSDKSEYLSLGNNGTSSTTVLKFQSSGPFVDYLTLPSTTGILLTSGNLHSITAESGAMTSLHVKGHSDFLASFLIGTVDSLPRSRGSRVGEGTRTTVHDGMSPSCEACDLIGVCDLCNVPNTVVTVNRTFISAKEGGFSGGETKLTFESKPGSWAINFPVWDDNLCTGYDRQSCVGRNATSQLAQMKSTAITTGNLGDMTHLNPNMIQSTGRMNLFGAVELGSSYNCATGKYPLAGWSVHTQASCLEVGTVAWNSTDVLALNTSACKKACEDQPWCGVAILKSELDRRQTDPRCMLVRRRASECKVASTPQHDLYLLYRQGPSPWLSQQGNTSFFEQMCRDPLNNVSTIPSAGIRIDGFINGEMTYRPDVPLTWKERKNMTCSSFEGKTPSILRKLNLTQPSDLLPQAPIQLNMSNVNTSNAKNAINQTIPTPVNKTASINITIDYCRQLCELDPACKIVTISYQDKQCWLMEGVSERRVLPDWSVIKGSCWLEQSSIHDVYELIRNESIRFSFNPPTDVRRLAFADASGVIITSGNTYDIKEGVGLGGSDSISYYHAKTSIPQRLLDPSAKFDVIRSPDRIYSFASEKEKGFTVRACDRFDGCQVFASSSLDDATVDRYIDEHITKRYFLLDNSTGSRGQRGSGDGFDVYRTIVDVAEPGSRLGDAPCGQDCKGRLPCQRATPTCHKDCPGWMLPFSRPGISIVDYCADPSKNIELNVRGDRCGCVGGYGYGLFGTAVCVIPDIAHPMHGAFCENTTADGTTYKLDNVTCCADPSNNATCGVCTAFPPVMPYGKQNRITFPEATGVVLTTGNIDSLALTDVQLEGLELDGPANFGRQNIDDDMRPKTGYPFGYYTQMVNGILIYRALTDFDPSTSTINGGLRMVSGYGDPTLRYGTTLLQGTGQISPFTLLDMAPHTPFTGKVDDLPENQQRYCVESVPYEQYKTTSSLMDYDRLNPERCLMKREILLPDVTGDVITTGNLQKLPSMAVPREGLFMTGSQSSLEIMGNLTLGRRVNYAEDPSNNIDGSDNGHRSLLAMHTVINGDIGLTFQSASEYMPSWVIHREIDQMTNYSKFGLGAPFGGSAPTKEVDRFAREGREKPLRTRLWERDIIKLNPAVLGGVDSAIRDYLRDGSPSLAVTVTDEYSLTQRGAPRDNFGYSTGRPVLQQRPGRLPSLMNTYPAFNADIPSFIGSSAVQGATTIDAKYCKEKMMQLGILDSATGAAGASYYQMFSSYLVGRSLVVPTLINGVLLSPPAYDVNRLESTRLNSAACAAFANNTRSILGGAGTLLSGPSNRIAGATARLLTYTTSSQEYISGIECSPLMWNDHTVDADFVRYPQSTCEVGGGGQSGQVIMDTASADECAMACLRYGTACKGYTVVQEPKHLSRGLFGDCTMSLGVCNLKPSGNTGATFLFVDKMFVSKAEMFSRSRDCATEYDYSSSAFDLLRQDVGIMTGSGSGTTGPLSSPEACYACCALKVPQDEMTLRSSDGNLSTVMDYYTGSGCRVVLDVGPQSKAVRAIRYAPRKGYSNRMVGGRFQGSNISSADGFEDIFTVREAPREEIFTDVEVQASGWYRWLRYLAPDSSFCSVAEFEFHANVFSSPLSPVQSGSTSYWLNDTALVKDAGASELVKCAAHGMIPAWLDNSMQEIVLPEANGYALTTGSLSDITIKSGKMSSVSVAGDLSVGGSAILGSLSEQSSISFNSELVGQSVFRFQGDAGGAKAFPGGILDVGVIKTPGDKFVQMPDATGTLVVGELPPVMKGMLVLPDGALDMTWTVSLGADTSIKSSSLDGTASLQINSAVSGSFPISFDGSVRGPAQTTLSSPEPTIDSVITFPDASGTILTTGNIPSVLSNITSIHGARMQGGARFLDGDVMIGEAERPVNLDIFAHILGANSLIFDGSSSKDGRTLVLSADDPQGDNHLTLPDASGTIITSGNFPSVFENLHAIGNVSVTGSASFDAGLIKIGIPGGNTRLSLPATIRGSFPLVFDGGLAADTGSSIGMSCGIDCGVRIQHMRFTSHHLICTLTLASEDRSVLST